MNIADLNSEARALVDADTTSYTAADLLRRINAAYEEIVGYILGLDGLWQYDDTNYTDFPIGTTTLIEGQKDYTFDSAHLEIEGISVEDAGGIWHQLDPIDQSNFGQDPAEFQKNSGMPIYYDKSGRSFLLYPAPTASAVTLASGCKVYFKRTAASGYEACP